MKRLTLGIAAALCTLTFTGITPAFGGLPGNDCDSAVEAITGANPFDTTKMSDSGFGLPDETQCADTFLNWGEDNEDFWFYWTPPCDGIASFSTCDMMSFDTSMVLYAGSTCDSVVQIACNGDGPSDPFDDCQNYHSLIEGIPVTAGQQYYIRIGSWQGGMVGQGTLTISVEISGGACCYNGTECTDCVSPEECEEGGGFFFGEGTTCDNEGATCAPGACCFWGEWCNEPVSEEECNDAGGYFLGNGSTCEKEGLTCQPGACCWEDLNECTETTYENCSGSNAQWHGYGSTCDEDAPGCTPGPPGACCFGGDCYEVTQYECAFNGGSWSGGDCGPCTCVQCGTCCFGTTCEEDVDIDYCEGVGGEWMGNVSCTENTCSVDVGVCCFGGGCLEMPNENGEQLCVAVGGSWAGDGMLCEDFNCLAGACCFMDPDHCVDGYDSAGCEEAGGEYLGDSTTCADEGVICSPVYGACCEDGAYCTDNVDSGDCNDMGGDFLGADSTCDDEGVTCNTGACCWEKFMDCSHTDYNNCESSGGTWLGYGSSCDNEGEYCDPGPYGACCFDGNCASTYQWECTYNGGSWLGGDCTECSCAYCGTCCIDDECEEDYPYDACELNNGTWLGNVSCTDDLCAPPAPTGACCTDGQCTINTEEDCEGIYLGDDTSCTGDPCDGNEDGPFLGMFYVLVGENLVDDPDPTWTVDVYVEVEAGARLDAVAGDVNNPKMVSTTGSFYQNPYGGPTSQDINPALFGTFPDLEYDSFVTIELLTQEGNALSDIGIDWTAFETGGAVDSTDGSWFITPDDPQGLAGNGHDEDCDGIADEYGVRIARLTVRGGDSIVWVEALFQGKDAGGQTWTSSDLLAIANTGGACVPDDSTCYADINGDGVVDVLDLLLVISDWGACSGSCASDIDGNGAVDVLDLLEIIANWGPCPVVCEEGFVCGSGDDAYDYICGETCYCFELADGSDSCVDIGTGSCGNFDICPDGTCPEGYGCVVSSCCEDPICIPFCD